MVSTSKPSGVTNKIGCFVSLIKAPTHGANCPCRPINIELGICSFTNSASFLTSNINASVWLAIASNSFGDRGVSPFFNIVSKLSYPFIFIITF